MCHLRVTLFPALFVACTILSPYPCFGKETTSRNDTAPGPTVITTAILALPGHAPGQIRFFVPLELAEGFASDIQAMGKGVSIESHLLNPKNLSSALAAEGVAYTPADATSTEAGADANDRTYSNFYGRPMVEIVAGIGVPNLLSSRVEVAIADSWNVGIAGGIGLLPASAEATLRWTPQRLTLGQGKRNQASLGLGPDFIIMPTQNMVAFILSGSVEAEYLHWFSKSFGFTTGTRWGLGATTEFGSAQPTQTFKVEPAFNIVLLQIGVVIGK